MEKETKRNIFFGCLITLAICGLCLDIYLTHKENQEKDKNLNVVQNSLSKELIEKTTCVYKRDSLIKENKLLSIYKTLTASMVYRDEVTSELNHRVGDITYLKNDSSKVVIEDIIIGGSKHNFYVKYKVLLKDNTTRELIPELIY